MQNQKIPIKGFTLLELLVVVAIIGLLAAVVMAALSNARNKGNDAGIQTNLHTVITQAELFYSGQNSYLPTGGSDFTPGPCPSVYNASAPNMFRKKTIFDAVSQAVSLGSGSYCYNTSTAWAVAVGLKANTAASWCVDNSGTSKQESFTPNLAINPTTLTCN